MGNKSDLQKQVERFKTRAKDAEKRAEQISTLLLAARQENEELVLQRVNLMSAMQQARRLATALAAVQGEVAVIPADIAAAVDAQEITGISSIDPQEDGSIQVTVSYADQEPDAEEPEEEDDSLE